MRPFLEPKSLENQFQSGLARALEEDISSKLKKYRSRFMWGVLTRLKVEVFEASGGGRGRPSAQILCGTLKGLIGGNRGELWIGGPSKNPG